MKSLITISAFSLMLVLVSSACVEDYPFDGKPTIGLVQSGPDTVYEFVDSIYFKISYEDGDGDLGENNTDDKNLFVTDNRNGIQYKYRIRELVPGNTNVPVQGVLAFSINNTFIIGTGKEELVTYNIHVVDRAGNTSNTLTSQQILIRR